jgi:hypothetical protein
VTLLNAEWVSDEQRQGALAFLQFLGSKESLQGGLKYYFRPAQAGSSLSLASVLSRHSAQGFKDSYATVELPPYEALNAASYQWHNQIISNASFEDRLITLQEKYVKRLRPLLVASSLTSFTDGPEWHFGSQGPESYNPGACQPKLVLVMVCRSVSCRIPHALCALLRRGGFKYLMRNGANLTNAHYSHATTYTGPGTCPDPLRFIRSHQRYNRQSLV